MKNFGSTKLNDGTEVIVHVVVDDLGPTKVEVYDEIGFRFSFNFDPDGCQCPDKNAVNTHVLLTAYDRPRMPQPQDFPDTHFEEVLIN